MFLDVRDYTQLGAEMFEVPHRLVHSRTKARDVTKVRYAIFKALTLQGYGITQVGRWFGLDHTTVRHGVKRANEIMPENPEFRAKVIELSKFEIRGKARRKQAIKGTEEFYSLT